MSTIINHNFIPPKDAEEILQRGYEFAKEEANWETNDWCNLDATLVPNSWKFPQGYNKNDYVSPEYHQVEDTGWWENVSPPVRIAMLEENLNTPICTNVKACAMGIVIIVTLDGPAAIEMIAMGKQPDRIAKTELRKAPGGFDAVLYLAQGLGWHKPDDAYADDYDAYDDDDAYDTRRCVIFDSAMEYIVTSNDNEDRFVNWDADKGDLDYDKTAHHQAIVEGFRRGLEFAREAKQAPVS